MSNALVAGQYAAADRALARACATVGARLADRIFETRSQTVPGLADSKPKQIRVSKNQLAAMLGIAVEEGWRLRDRRGRKR